MPVQLNHTIVSATDKERSARFLADLLGLEVQPQYGPFLPVVMENGVALDYADAGDRPVTPQHYAFLVSEEDFDAIFGRLEAAGITYYADPFHRRVNEINHHDGGRGVYWEDPDRHNMEIITRPYGG